jgi:hypothetical protein
MYEDYVFVIVCETPEGARDIWGDGYYTTYNEAYHVVCRLKQETARKFIYNDYEIITLTKVY